MLKGPRQALFGAHFVACGIGTRPRRINKESAATQQPQPRLSAQVNWQLGASHPSLAPPASDARNQSGKPSTRLAMILSCTSLVPPAMVKDF